MSAVQVGRPRAGYRRFINEDDIAMFIFIAVIAILVLIGICLLAYMKTPIVFSSGSMADSRKNLIVTNSATIRSSGCMNFSFSNGNDTRWAKQTDVIPNESECAEYFELKDSFPIGVWSIHTEREPSFWDFFPDDVLIKNLTPDTDVDLQFKLEMRLYIYYRYTVVAFLAWLAFSLILKGGISFLEYVDA